MFLTLLIVTFLVATAVSSVVALVFSKSAGQILDHIIGNGLSAVWRRYLLFALFVVGISSGVRTWDLEKYITKPAVTGAEVVQLTSERWILEVYRTVIGSLQGLAWALLVFFICTLFAFVTIQIFSIKKPARGTNPA